MLKLHVGCGGVNIPGYINIDIQNGPAVEIIADARDLPFEHCSANTIYSCCVLEHFSRHEWISVLAHWFDILEPDGILRLSVPDFKACCEEYWNSHNINLLFGLIVGGQKDEYDRHGVIFDFEYLSKKLSGVGFTDICRYDWREVEPGSLGIDDYSQAYIPHMDKSFGRQMCLNIQAVKPRS